MRKKNIALGLCLVTAVASMTACGGSEEVEQVVTEAVQTEVKETKAVETVQEVKEQKITVLLNIAEDDNEDAVNLPFDEFNKYGKVVKTKEGYRVLSKDGTYVTDALLNVDGNCFYFDDNGYLKDNVFVPAQNSQGKLITLYVHNYSYVYGLIQTPEGNIYYIDEDLGRFESTSKEIDGKMYYFDDEGRSISEKTFNKKYASNSSVSEEETVVELKQASGDYSAISFGGNAIFMGQSLLYDLDNAYAEDGLSAVNDTCIDTHTYFNLTVYGYELAENVSVVYALECGDDGDWTLPEEFVNRSDADWISAIGEPVKIEEVDGGKLIYWETEFECIKVGIKDGVTISFAVLNKDALNTLLTVKGFSTESVADLSDHLIKYFTGEEVFDYYIVAFSKATLASDSSEAVETNEVDTEAVVEEVAEVEETKAE